MQLCQRATVKGLLADTLDGVREADRTGVQLGVQKSVFSDLCYAVRDREIGEGAGVQGLQIDDGAVIKGDTALFINGMVLYLSENFRRNDVADRRIEKDCFHNAVRVDSSAVGKIEDVAFNGAALVKVGQIQSKAAVLIILRITMLRSSSMPFCPKRKADASRMMKSLRVN